MIRTSLPIAGMVVLLAAVQAGGEPRAAARPSAPSAVEPDALDALFRRLILEAMPEEYVDERDWGKTKMFATDLHVRRDGLKIETRRKREPLHHGKWEKYRISLADAEKFQINLHSVDSTETGAAGFVVDVAAPLRLHARQSQWRRGVQLWSVSADAEATVRMRLHCEASLKLTAAEGAPGVAIRPRVASAELQLERFRLLGVSKIRGGAAEELGRAMRGKIARRLADQEDRLVQKVNARLEGEDRLRLPLPGRPR